MEKLKIVDVKQISYCPKGRYNVPLDDCEKCVYFGGFDEDTVKCSKPNLIDFNSMIVTRFTSNDKEFERREYDKNIDGEIIGDDPYDFCQKCDMFKLLPNGKRYCALRNNVPIDALYPFICEHRNIWKEVVKK